MGHELIIYGMIEGLTKPVLEERNRGVINRLPDEDEWPRINRQMFQIPAAYPYGTYQTQIIHFGLSMKDGAPLTQDMNYDPINNWRSPKRDSITGWIEEFESLLRQMYWYGANLHIQSDFEPDRLFSYNISGSTVKEMLHPTAPTPVSNWHITVTAT